MGRDETAAAGREQKARSIIDFATNLSSKLRDPVSPELLLADISHHISIITALSQRTPPIASSKTMKNLEQQGRELWNACIRLNRDEPPGSPYLLSRARLVAFLSLELGRSSGRRKRDDASEAAYLLGLAMTLGRICLKCDDLESGRTALEKAAGYVDCLRHSTQQNENGDVGLENAMKLELAYFTIRIALSWKEGRLDVAEHIFGKVEDLLKHIDTPSAESLADTLRHIGADMLAKTDLSMAAKWLRRAYDVIHTQSVEDLSVEGLDIRLATCHDLIQSLLTKGSTEAMSEADSLISYIESEVGDRPVVLHWRLELLQHEPEEVFDAESYASILRRMINAFDFSDQSFLFLIHHIKDLHVKCSKLAFGLLDELLMSKVLQSGKEDWLAKLIVRRVWMSTMEEDLSRPLDGARLLISLLDSVLESMNGRLDPDVVGAVQSLLWKKLESTYAQKQYEITDEWCEAALHGLFIHCGELNQIKFWRRRILCAIGLNSAERARSACASMPEGGQIQPLTQYLMFKVSLLDWNSELGCQSIEQLVKSTWDGRHQEMLYACVREAQQAGDKLCTLAALKAVGETWDSSTSLSSSLTTIIRCSIRLIIIMEGSGEFQPHEFDEDTCKLFEMAADQGKRGQRDNEGNKVFTVPELNWFSKNSYNIAVTWCGHSELNLPRIVRLLDSCLDFIGCYPSDIATKDADELALMTMRCHFVNGAALVSLARASDHVDEQLQRYLQTRQHAAVFSTLLDGELGKQPEEVRQDLLQKMSTLLVFDFEGAVALKSWDELSSIVRKAERCRGEVSLKAMGDCLLRSHASGRVLFATMSIIINQIHAIEDFDCERLAKYIRCVFQATLPLDDSLALQLVDQALEVAQQSKQAGRAFPSSELEWLVATSFNHSIDFYARGEEELCSRWALKAMDLASHMDDEGQLCNLLQDKYARLQFRPRKYE